MRLARSAAREEGIDAEVVDLRTVLPGTGRPSRSVKKTGKALVVHEDNLTMAMAEVAAIPLTRVNI
jgi:2-oxoisovalerate dehydrogenase E1 component beta subunit